MKVSNFPCIPILIRTKLFTCCLLYTSNLANNSIGGIIPVSIGSCRELTTINLSGNKLTGEIPSTIGNLTQLTSVNLSNNQLSGLLPSTIGALKAVTTLNLSSNKLNGLGDGISQMTSLKTLNVKANKVLTGPIPVSYTHLDVYKRQSL